MKKILLLFFIPLFAILVAQPALGATKPDLFGLKIAPLEVRAELKKGQKKKGYVEVSNPSNKTVQVVSSVRGFKQIDDSGALRFYQDEQIEAGIQVDLNEFELPPWSAARVYYLLDGTKLPTGDVFAAIFFSTSQQQDSVLSIQPSVRVGTLLSIVNGTSPSHQATITKLEVSLFQFGDIKGTYTIKNTGKEDSTGFYPQVKLGLQPFSQTEEVTSRLVFPGIERANNFSVTPNYPGIYQLKVTHQDSEKSTLVFVVTTELIIGLVVFVVLVLVTVRLMIVRRSRRPRKYARRPQNRIRRGLNVRKKR